MSYSNIISDMDRHVMADMNRTVLLDIRLLSNHYRSIISTDHCIIQHTAVTTDRHITQDHRLFCDPGTFCNFYIFIIHINLQTLSRGYSRSAGYFPDSAKLFSNHRLSSAHVISGTDHDICILEFFLRLLTVK